MADENYPRLMVCGHFSYWYAFKKQKVIKQKDIVEFGPGCIACFNRQPKHYDMQVREEFGSDEELYDPTKDHE